MKMNRKGFTLIELMIVVAIIAIISAIAIPNLMKSKAQTNEIAAITSLKTINTAQYQYEREFTTFTPYFTQLAGYAADTNTHTTQADSTGSTTFMNSPSLQDTTLVLSDITLREQADAVAKSGYFFYSNPTYGSLRFMVAASPGIYGTSGSKTYITSEKGSVYQIEGIVDQIADDVRDEYIKVDAWKNNIGFWTAAR